VGTDSIRTIDKLRELVEPGIARLTGRSKIHMFGMGSESTIAHEKSRLLMEGIKIVAMEYFPKNA
jgi:UDP-N-acetylmuramyl pentapeptide synthase